MGIEQILAIIIFIAMFIMIILDIVPKHYVTLGCGLFVLVVVFLCIMHNGQAVLEVLNIKSIFSINFWHVTGENSSSQGVDWATIFFLAGMMIMVEGMAESGFFRWLCMRLAKLVHYKTVPLFISFMVLSTILAMFIDSITVILFLAAITVELSQLLKFNPVPMIISEIFCANLGGSATMCGDPPNIIIGSQLGYTFMDFMTNTGLIVLIALSVVILFFYLAYRKSLQPTEVIDVTTMPDPKDAIKNQRDFLMSILIFACAIFLLITHAKTHLTVAFIGCFIAILTLIAFPKSALKLIKKVDYKTLLFFVGLFIVVGGLEKTGVIGLIASAIGSVCGNNIYAMTAIILWISAVASAFVDNIPFAATMVPIIRLLASSTGVPIEVLAWSLALGTDVGGNATPIGASANVVGISVAGKHGHRITWGTYCKTMAPATIIVTLIAMVVIFIRYC